MAVDDMPMGTEKTGGENRERVLRKSGPGRVHGISFQLYRTGTKLLVMVMSQIKKKKLTVRIGWMNF